jgi:hypothetical protein
LMNETRKPDMRFEASDEYFSLKESLRVVKKRLWAIVLVVVVFFRRPSTKLPLRY